MNTEQRNEAVCWIVSPVECIERAFEDWECRKQKKSFYIL